MDTTDHDGQDADLLIAIALRLGTARELSERFELTIDELRAIVAAAGGEIAGLREIAIDHLRQVLTRSGPLWITSREERLRRAQVIAERLMSDVMDAVALREFRSYLAYVAGELGQLRGGGEPTGDMLSVDIQGIDMEALR